MLHALWPVDVIISSLWPRKLRSQTTNRHRFTGSLRFSSLERCVWFFPFRGFCIFLFYEGGVRRAEDLLIMDYTAGFSVTFSIKDSRNFSKPKICSWNYRKPESNALHVRELHLAGEKIKVYPSVELETNILHSRQVSLTQSKPFMSTTLLGSGKAAVDPKKLTS